MPTASRAATASRLARLNAKQPVTDVMLSPEALARINKKMMAERQAGVNYRTGHMVMDVHKPLVHMASPFKVGQSQIVMEAKIEASAFFA